MHNGKMYIFGGILELTKELNEMLCYDFETRAFCALSSETQDLIQTSANLRAGDDSPGVKKSSTLRKQATAATS